MNDILKNMNIDKWYKMVIVISFGLLVLSLTVPIHLIGNGALFLISLGTMFIGIGEWINHPKAIKFMDDGFIGYGTPRLPHPGGIILDIVGAIFISIGVGIAIYVVLL